MSILRKIYKYITYRKGFGRFTLELAVEETNVTAVQINVISGKTNKHMIANHVS